MHSAGFRIGFGRIISIPYPIPYLFSDTEAERMRIRISDYADSNTGLGGFGSGTVTEMHRIGNGHLPYSYMRNI